MFRPAAFLVALGVVLSASPVAWASSSATPYQDPGAIGRIGLCDRAGNAVTHGNINAKPFVWRAVSTQPARPPYNEAGRTATLYAYQPREQVPAGDWSGDQLTATTRYSNAAHPMAQATGGDESLKDFIEEFHPEWDGLLQLRIFLGGPGQQTDSFSYPATSIKVTGNTWQVVDPVTVSCTSGKAESIESILLPASTTSGKSATKRGHHHAAGSQTQAPTSGSGPVTPAGVSNAADAKSASGGHSTGLEIGLVCALVVIAVGGFAARRRHHRSVSALPADGTGEDK